MAARSIASLTVSFGLVSIPVKLFSATEAGRAISFNLLHKACGSRLKQQYFCVKEEVPVSREDMVKGYEFAKDQYVMFTPEELKELEEAGQQAADRFDPTAYTDEVRARIQAAIDKKVEQGQEITLAEAPQPAGQVIDLMEALRASLEKKPAKRAPAAAPAQSAKPARKAAAKK